MCGIAGINSKFLLHSIPVLYQANALAFHLASAVPEAGNVLWPSVTKTF